MSGVVGDEVETHKQEQDRHGKANQNLGTLEAESNVSD